MAPTDHSGSNIELVREAYTTFWDNEFEAIFALFEKDFEWIVLVGFPYGGQYLAGTK